MLGHIRVWDVSAGVNTSSQEACRSSFRQMAHWRAHPLGINTLAYVEGHDMIIAGSKDTNVSIWTLDGLLVRSVNL